MKSIKVIINVFVQFGYTYQLLNRMKTLLDFFVMFDDENMIILNQRKVLIYTCVKMPAVGQGFTNETSSTARRGKFLNNTSVLVNPEQIVWTKIVT